jgi:acyl carrier protein
MVRETIVQQMGLSPAAVTLNARLVEDLNFSPLDMVMFIMKVEEEARVAIPDADVQSFKTVGDVVRFVDGLTAEN